jgi:toxin ParE1/3/4
MKVLWAPEAIQDRIDIWEFISEENPLAAATLDALFSEAVMRLSAYPMIGKPGIKKGTREIFPHENYRLVYEISGESIWILALLHTSRLWPPLKKY